MRNALYNVLMVITVTVPKKIVGKQLNLFIIRLMRLIKLVCNNRICLLLSLLLQIIMHAEIFATKSCVNLHPHVLSYLMFYEYAYIKQPFELNTLPFRF